MSSDVQKPTNQSRYGLIYVTLPCGIALCSAILISEVILGWNLISHPVKAIGFLWVVEGPVVVLAYSQIRLNPQTCSKMWAIGRGLLSFPIGALVNAFGAIVFGAPLGLEYAARTLHWSLLMSSLTFRPVQDWFRPKLVNSCLGGWFNWKPPKADSTWQFYQFWFSSNNIGSNAPLKLHLLGIISLQRAETCFILLLQKL
eukprot:PITA_27622